MTDMPLPIVGVVNRPGVGDLLRLFAKCDAEWVSHLAEPVEVDFGVVLANAELADVWNANHVRNVVLPPGMTPEAAWEVVDAHFAARGARCRYWEMSLTADAARVGPMADFLAARGFRPDPCDVMYLRRRPEGLVPASIPGVQIIPARASYRHAGELARQAAEESPGRPEQVAEARLRHLDDPHWDALLALENGQAIAGVGVLAVGELGLVEQVYVAPSHRRRGIGQIMMGRALEICARAQFRHVFLSVAASNEPAKALYRKMGFERIGETVAYLAEAM